MFIVLEGCDAAGKNTQAERLRVRLERMGREVAAFSFPRYKTELGEAIRRHLHKEILVAEGVEVGIRADVAMQTRAPEDPLVFQSMMVTDKYDAAPDIEAALKRNAVVVCDRWWQSAYCYGAADGLAKEWLLRAHQRLPQADLNVWIDVSIEEAHRRRPKARDRYEEDREKQATVRENYRALWGAVDDPLNAPPRHGRWLHVNGEGSKEVVHEEIWQHIVEQNRRASQ
jgi:dTMP kinase